MNIIEVIKERRSVRSFNGESLSQAQRNELKNAINTVESPFGGNVTIRLQSFDIKDGFKPSTYGMIKGAVDFFLLGIKDDKQSALTAGFKFEQVVLKAWRLKVRTESRLKNYFSTKISRPLMTRRVNLERLLKCCVWLPPQPTLSHGELW